MITTREAINYQYSLIFGYSSPNDVRVGDVIGPGKLTKNRIKELVKEVIRFLRMYNAILRDYTGSELFSIEFKLSSVQELLDNEKDSQIKIYPKSMILVPGKFKDCESLFLALKPETGVLNTHKSKQAIDNISKLFFEVEEFSNRPELKIEGKKAVYQKFASRFNHKLYGDLIEDKWNKKLIGLSTSLPTEKKMLSSYAEIKSNTEIIWYKKPYEINIINPEFQKIDTNYEEDLAIAHLKYSLSEPSINFIINNTLKLGINLFNLSNIGTLDEIQDDVVSFLISQIEENIEKINESMEARTFISHCDKLLIDLQVHTNKFLNFSKEFLTTGEIGNLAKLLESYKAFIRDKGIKENEDFDELCDITINSINRVIIKEEKLRVIEFTSIINYFSEIIKSSFKLIRKSLPQYLTLCRFKTFTRDLINTLKKELEKGEKTVNILGNKIIEKYYFFLLNQIEISPILSLKKFDEQIINEEFIKLIKSTLTSFFENIELNISDIISFAEAMMLEDVSLIESDLKKFKSFSKELKYLLSYILRFSTINRYIKDEPDVEITDPVTFSSRFHRFLEKRVGGINLSWKSYILEWIKDYSKRFLKQGLQKEWTLKEVYEDFIGYLKERELNEQEPESFLEFLDKYIGKVPESEKSSLKKFQKYYKMCLGLKLKFPEFLKEKTEICLKALIFLVEYKKSLEFMNYNVEDSYYNYIKEMELKYFSKLIPRPLTLILKHNLTNKERKIINGDLFHVFNFEFLSANELKIDIANNFNKVYTEW